MENVKRPEEAINKNQEGHLQKSTDSSSHPDQLHSAMNPGDMCNEIGSKAEVNESSSPSMERKGSDMSHGLVLSKRTRSNFRPEADTNSSLADGSRHLFKQGSRTEEQSGTESAPATTVALAAPATSLRLPAGGNQLRNNESEVAAAVHGVDTNRETDAS